MLFVLLAVVSRYYLFYMKITSETTVGIGHSSLMVVSTSIGTSPPTWSVTAKPMFSPNTAWTPSYVSTGRSMRAVLPCVYPAGLFLCMLCVHHFRTRKRVSKDECTHCGYNVSQLTVCPECGTAVT
jgi:hypothetical protein